MSVSLNTQLNTNSDPSMDDQGLNQGLWQQEVKQQNQRLEREQSEHKILFPAWTPGAEPSIALNESTPQSAAQPRAAAQIASLPKEPLLQSRSQPCPRNEHSYDKAPNIDLSDFQSQDRQRKLDELGDYYKTITHGKKMHVTSGRRTPAQQADAMYRKFQTGDHKQWDIYSNKAALNQIKNAYDQAMAEGQKRGLKGADLRKYVEDEMTQVIERQMKDGILISPHLVGNGIDIRTNNMTEQQKKDFEEAVKRAGLRPVHEADHLHITFPREQVANK